MPKEEESFDGEVHVAAFRFADLRTRLEDLARRGGAKALVGGALGCVVAGWLLTKAVGDIGQFVTTTLNGITLAALYFVVASGFTLIFGLMRTINMAHGSLYLLGGYLAFEMQESWFAEETGGLELSIGQGGGDAEYGLFGWLVPVLLGALAMAVLGVLIYQVLLSWNQGQELRQALITIALVIIFADQMLAHFGGVAKDIKEPASWPTSVNLPVADASIGFFRLTIVLGSALLIGGLLFWMIKRTRFGLITRAGVDDRDMVAALGIRIPLVFAGAFFIGSFLAGFGGVLGGTMLSLQPGEDTAFLLNSLIVVIIGGMGSLGGAAIGAIALGLVQAYAGAFLTFGGTDLTNYSILLTFALVVAVLAVRPYGLFGRPA
jgi:branched-chain amino acid transport system permease protein